MEKQHGYFYLAQLYPDINPDLYKVGYSKNPALRADDHRCLAPKLKMIKTWSGDKSLEQKILKKIKTTDFYYGGEVFVNPRGDFVIIVCITK